MKDVTWRPVNSSNVIQVGWPDSGLDLYTWRGPDITGIEPRVLFVRFSNGRAFGYLGVSRQRAVYMATRCKSVGSYLNRVVKPNFKVMRIPELDATDVPF